MTNDISISDNISSKKKKDSRFDLKNLVWLGFNYTCGMAFPLSFATLITDKTQGIGMYIFIVLLIGSFLAAVMGYAYSKMAKVYTKSNGGTYVYVRGCFGKFWGWLIGAIQYIAIPIMVAGMILSMIAINFYDIVGSSWGPYTDLYLNLIGIGVYFVASFSIYFGLRYFRIFVTFAGVIKWVSTVFVVFCVFALAGRDNFNGFSSIISNQPKLTFLNFNNAFVSFFYFYGGFETYTTIAKNVKNPSKTIPRSILWITLLTLLFYVIVMILFMSVNEPDTAKGEWFSTNPPLDVAKEVAGTLGVVFVIGAMVALKLNAAMQASLYSSSMLEPLAKEHFITPKLSQVNHDGVSLRAASLNILLTIILTFLLTCVPILLNGGAQNSNIDYTSILGFSTLIMLMQYALVAIGLLYLFSKKQMLLKWWEFTIFLLVLIFIIFQGIVYVYLQFVNASSIWKKGTFSTSQLVNGWFSLVEIILFTIILGLITLFYFAYYMPIYKKRVRDYPELQRKFDELFEISEYASLEKESYYELKSQLKSLKIELKSQLKSISNNSKTNYRLTKKEILNKYKNDLNISKKYLNDKKREFKKDVDEWEKITEERKSFFNKKNQLKNEKNINLENAKMKLEFYAFKKQYKENKKTSIKERNILLENFINNK